jgi:putative oxygen-independent coproporphyrinogen III oxidase
MHAGNESFSLYIHIPYCISKCPYCDFNSHVVAEIPERAYTEALTRELDQYAGRDEWRNRSIQSIFFGGGTPSTFHPQSIDKILRQATARFDLLPDCEITLEANPGTVDRAHFVGYRATGVNRISLGVQSFQPRLLKFLGRVHSADEAKIALRVVREAGFDNFSLDLIYANPGQTLEELSTDLEIALSFGSPHLSAYNLTIEAGTPFHHEFLSGRIALLSEAEEIAMAELVEQKLKEARLERYEISNYARPGFHSRHNVNYWQGGDYLGIGAGAHSYRKAKTDGIYGWRWWNVPTPSRYMQTVSRNGQAVVESEQPDIKKAAAEFMFSGLRLTGGISLDAFAARFGQMPVAFYPQIPDWVSEGFMEEDQNRLRLSRRGFMVANSIFVHFV